MENFLKIKYAVLVMILFLSSCFPEDEMVPPHEPGDLQEGRVEIGTDYRYHSFYDLATNSVVSKVSNLDWDLGFESAGDGYNIILNTSRFMYAGNTGKTDFGEVTSADSLAMIFDPSSGNPDSLVFKDWYVGNEDTMYSKKEVWVVDMGLNDAGISIGFKKVQFDFAGDDYTVRYADLDNQNEGTLVVERDPDVNFICVSFENGIADIEPDRTSWTFKVTRYTTMLWTNEGEEYPYIVFGVLLNPNKVVAALDTIRDFAEITLQDTLDVQLSNRQDVIGYDWKYYNFDDQVYTIVPEFSYIIRDRDGFYYKLRFIDFYNDTGEKGNPEFEFLAL